MVQEVGVRLVVFGVAPILLHLAIDFDGIEDGTTILEDVICILISHLAVTNEGGCVVLHNESTVFLDHCSDRIQILFVGHDLEVQ